MTKTARDDLTINNWMAAWNAPERSASHREPGMIIVGPWPDKTGWSRPCASTIGCCDLERREWPLHDKIMMMFIDFHTIVVGDGIDPQEAHREFLKIDEYRRRISPDIPGAARMTRPPPASARPA